MGLTPTEALRLQVLEKSVNDLQTALNKLATKKQLKSLLSIRQTDIDSLTTIVNTIDETGITPALSTHIDDATAHTVINSRFFLQSEFLNVSAGSADAGKPIVLDSSGKIDSTMIP